MEVMCARYAGLGISKEGREGLPARVAGTGRRNAFEAVSTWSSCPSGAFGMPWAALLSVTHPSTTGAPSGALPLLTPTTERRAAQSASLRVLSPGATAQAAGGTDRTSAGSADSLYMHRRAVQHARSRPTSRSTTSASSCPSTFSSSPPGTGPT